jgi:hypothetical protein
MKHAVMSFQGVARGLRDRSEPGDPGEAQHLLCQNQGADDGREGRVRPLPHLAQGCRDVPGSRIDAHRFCRKSLPWCRKPRRTPRTSSRASRAPWTRSTPRARSCRGSQRRRQRPFPALPKPQVGCAFN